MSLCKSWLWIQITVFSYTYYVFIKESLHLDETLYKFIALRSKGIYSDTLHCAERIVHHVNSLRIKIQCKLSYTGASWGRSKLVSALLRAHSSHLHAGAAAHFMFTGKRGQMRCSCRTQGEVPALETGTAPRQVLASKSLLKGICF